MVQNLKNLIKYILKFGHQATSILDMPYLKKKTECSWPPVFILGTPRSGTSLLYQLLCHTFHVAYIPNIANTFYMCPIFATRLSKKFCPAHHTEFTSRYGYEKGCLAPSEAGNIWNRWFPHEKLEGFNYTPAGYLAKSDVQIITLMVANFESIFSAPFLTKNAKMGVRLPSLFELFPNALFIHIKRNLTDAAISILIRRRKENLNWWSVMPKETASFRQLTELEQVAHQVFYIEKNIEEDIRIFPEKNRYILTYEELCNNPAEQLEKILQFLNSNGCLIKTKDVKVPKTFLKSKPKTKSLISKEEVYKIQDILKSLMKTSLQNES